MAIVKKTGPLAKKAAPSKSVKKKPMAKNSVIKSKQQNKSLAAKQKAPLKKTTSAPKKNISAKPIKKEVKKSSALPSKKTPTPAKGKLPVSTKSITRNLPVKKTVKSIPPPASKKEISKPAVASKPVIPQSKKGNTKEIVVAKPVKIVAKSETKPVAAKNIPVSKTIVNKGPVKDAGKTQATKSEPVKEVAKKSSTTNSKSTPVKTGASRPDDKLDPLHVKAAKAMKELEETMDMNKVRPRIQAGSPPPAPKPVHRHVQPPLKLVEPTNTLKTKYQLEFEFRASPKILFNYLSDSSGLAGWFADEVRTKDNVYTFVWEGGESYAKLMAIKDLHLVRYSWLDDTDGTYFQFEITEDELTSDVALIITDFANPGERDSNIRLWESQVQKLRLLLGSF